MSEPAISPSTLVEANAIDRFRDLELASVAAKPVQADEMIDVLLAESDRQCAAARAAETGFGTPFDARIVRRSAVLGKAAEFLGLCQQKRDLVLPILYGRSPSRRGRA